MIKKLLRNLLYISIACAIISFLVVTVFGLRLINNNTQSDVGLILGNKVNLDGTPSARLQARLDHAKKLYDTGQIKKIIVSGDRGLSLHNEAEVMAQYLEEKGIPQKNIIVDKQGKNTQKSIQFGGQYAKLTNSDSIVIISQYYHLKRSQLLAKQNQLLSFLEVSYSAPKYFDPRDIYSLARETIAYPYYFFFKSPQIPEQSYASLTYQDREFLVYKVNNNKNLNFKYLDSNNTPYEKFNNLLEQNSNIIFSTNAGIYQENSMPLGLYTENGKEVHRVNKVKEAHGNFYLQPNGIFWLKNSIPQITKTTDYTQATNNPDFATQSGPMLLIDNKINSLFQENSPNKKIRSSVGITDQNEIYFVLSKDKCTFFELSQLHKNILKTPQALYLDGGISQTYIKENPTTPSNLINYGAFINETN